MLDRDLAELYAVETKRLKEAVRRNIERFPEDFMFEMNKEELENWRSQFASSNLSDKMGLRQPPFCFTEQGVAMLSSVLNSEKAINVNIAIIRTFVLIRKFALNYKELEAKIKKLEKKYNNNFQQVFKVLDLLLMEKQEQEEFKNRKRIGFKSE